MEMDGEIFKNLQLGVLYYSKPKSIVQRGMTTFKPSFTYFILPTTLHTTNQTLLQEGYHEVQNIITNPWPLT